MNIVFFALISLFYSVHTDQGRFMTWDNRSSHRLYGHHDATQSIGNKEIVVIPDMHKTNQYDNQIKVLKEHNISLEKNQAIIDKKCDTIIHSLNEFHNKETSSEAVIREILTMLMIKAGATCVVRNVPQLAPLVNIGTPDYQLGALKSAASLALATGCTSLVRASGIRMPSSRGGKIAAVVGRRVVQLAADSLLAKASFGQLAAGAVAVIVPAGLAAAAAALPAVGTLGAAGRFVGGMGGAGRGFLSRWRNLGSAIASLFTAGTILGAGGNNGGGHINNQAHCLIEPRRDGLTSLDVPRVGQTVSDTEVLRGGGLVADNELDDSDFCLQHLFSSNKFQSGDAVNDNRGSEVFVENDVGLASCESSYPTLQNLGTHQEQQGSYHALLNPEAERSMTVDFLVAESPVPAQAPKVEVNQSSSTSEATNYNIGHLSQPKQDVAVQRHGDEAASDAGSTEQANQQEVAHEAQEKLSSSNVVASLPNKNTDQFQLLALNGETSIDATNNNTSRSLQNPDTHQESEVSNQDLIKVPVTEASSTDAADLLAQTEALSHPALVEGDQPLHHQSEATNHDMGHLSQSKQDVGVLQDVVVQGQNHEVPGEILVETLLREDSAALVNQQEVAREAQEEFAENLNGEMQGGNDESFDQATWYPEEVDQENHDDQKSEAVEKKQTIAGTVTDTEPEEDMYPPRDPNSAVDVHLDQPQQPKIEPVSPEDSVVASGPESLHSSIPSETDKQMQAVNRRIAEIQKEMKKTRKQALRRLKQLDGHMQPQQVEHVQQQDNSLPKDDVTTVNLEEKMQKGVNKTAQFKKEAPGGKLSSLVLKTVSDGQEDKNGNETVSDTKPSVPKPRF